DHASDDASFRLLPRRPFPDRTISNASISEENYFFEWGVRFRDAIAGFVFSPLGLTAIPPTENQELRSRGEAYRECQQRVSTRTCCAYARIAPRGRSSRSACGVTASQVA
ncbi:MAG TPA: hypothetical protein VIV58_37340, partial [Kofleriaceae bacterium]